MPNSNLLNLDHVVENLTRLKCPSIKVIEEKVIEERCISIRSSFSVTFWDKIGLRFKDLIVLISTTFKAKIN